MAAKFDKTAPITISTEQFIEITARLTLVELISAFNHAQEIKDSDHPARELEKAKDVFLDIAQRHQLSGSQLGDAERELQSVVFQKIAEEHFLGVQTLLTNWGYMPRQN